MITCAIQKGNMVYVYGTNNILLRQYFGKLHGYTSDTVSIYKDKHVYVYDISGRLKSKHYAG